MGWEIERDAVTICEELGHCGFGKVYKGVLKTPLCITHGPSTQQTSQKEEKLTTIVAVKMLRGNVKGGLLCVGWVKFLYEVDNCGL